MNAADLYPWLKALHVATALAFVGGVLVVSVFLAAVSEGDAAAASMARGIRRWDQAVTTPSMLLVWALGLTLATTGHWFADGWLQAKLALVFALSGLHGVQSGRLRRLAGADAIRPLRAAPFAIGCAVAIALLAVAKPF